MKTPISQFDYDLPKSFIAQAPAEPRESAKLLVLDRQTGEINHEHIFYLPKILKAGDVLVLNETKVFRARLHARAVEKERDVEVFLLREQNGIWEALIGGRRGLSVGMTLDFGSDLTAQIEALEDAGVTRLRFNFNHAGVLGYCEKYGEMPLPPYIEAKKELFDSYQTAFAKHTGSVAAPTAGFHFTKELLAELQTMGVQIEYITLHVGLGTFQPVKVEFIEDHVMHSEWAEITPEVAHKICSAKKEGRRIIAVGTTSVRTLEGAKKKLGDWENFENGFAGDLNLFITPGFQFEVVDAMLTNFHLPKSTLLMLVSAFAGREPVFHAYEEAKSQGYRFFSFGDAMFIE